MMLIVLALFGAFLWRLRGGLLNDLTGVANYKVGPIAFNDTVVRIIWAVGMASVFAVFHPMPYWQAEVLVTALFVSATIGWFGADVHLTKPSLRYVAIISASGLARMALVALVLLSPWPLVAGALCGPLYWVGSKIPRPFKGCVWQEILFGAAVGASLCLAG